MAHRGQQIFCESIRGLFPHQFIDRRVLDIGSLDINGNNRYLFSGGHYVGIDIAPGRNVDVVGLAHEFSAAPFDVVISTEMLEHDRHFRASLRNMVRLLKSGGLLLLTCATGKRVRHGTRDRLPEDSPFTSKIDGWADYYRNLSEADVRDVIAPQTTFSEFGFTETSHDLGFYGIKA